jgi:hypothetical protein
MLALVLFTHPAVRAADVSLEYRVKAVFLFNFIKFIEWPGPAESGPWTICVAERNPFGEVLSETVRGELVSDRPVTTRVVAAPDSKCHVLFVPEGAPAKPYLRAAREMHTLTVGETPEFLETGGMVNFVLEDGKVRFEIDPKAADSADLRISSHLLRLARIPALKGQR